MATVGPVYAATINATVDRSLLNAGESVQLTLNVKGDPDGDPNFGPLDSNFDVLSQNQNRSMQIINGSVSSTRQWVLTLMPKGQGVITIPPIAFGADVSNAVTITVMPAQTSRPGTAAADIFLQVKAEPKVAHVQAQVLYTVKVYIARNVTNASLTEPKLSDADAVIKKLGKDQRFDTVYMGRSYQVVERRYAIFPQQSGKLTIAPVTFDAKLVQSSGYGMNLFQQFGQNKRLRSESININIKPIPASQQTSTWLPAQAIKLQDAWTQAPTTFKVGEAITRTVTLTATGLTAAQLPEIMKSTPKGFKVYPDQPVLNDEVHGSGITGVRQEKMAMIATHPGHYVIPKITLNWWNTRTQHQETATLPERKINVVAAAANTTAHTAAAPQTRALGTNIAPPPPVVAYNANAQAEQRLKPSFWRWLSAFLGAGWLGTLLIIGYRYTRNKKTPKKKRNVKKEDAALTRKLTGKNLRQACQRNDVQAVKVALLTWANSLFPGQEITSIGDLAKCLKGPVVEQINALNHALYSPTPTDWQGQALWDSIQHYGKSQQTRPAEKEGLAPLYP